MKRLAAALLVLAIAGTAAAQTISGGVRFHPGGFNFEATLERGFDAFGIRLGPIVSARGGLAEWSTPEVTVLGGVGVTITPAGSAWGVQAQLLYKALFSAGSPTQHGPELVIAYTITLNP